MFGRESQPYQKAYDLHGVKIVEKENCILVDCSRCSKKEIDIKDYKIHSDGAITFSFICPECHWTYNIYRNRFADWKQVKRGLLN